jgi:hypothetical protein
MTAAEVSAAVSALRIEDLERATGRPRNSPGWGRLVAIRTKGIVTFEGACVFVEAGRTRVAPDSSYAREYPELFRPADRRDKATACIHRRNLHGAIRRLEAELRDAPPEMYGLTVRERPKKWGLEVAKAGATERDRRPIAHIAASQTSHRALCGAPMQGISAPRGVAQCFRCAEQWGDRGPS